MASQKIVGIFATEEEAILAIQRLKRDGYRDDEISVVAKDSEDIKKIRESTNTNIETESAAEGAAGGAVAGGLIGGAGALLAELGLIAIPGIGPLLAAGPIAATLTGLVAGGAVGGLVGALVDMGLTKEEAEEYEEYLDRGDILVMVDQHPDRDVERNFYENNSRIRDRYDTGRTFVDDSPTRRVDSSDPTERVDRSTTSRNYNDPTNRQF